MSLYGLFLIVIVVLAFMIATVAACRLNVFLSKRFPSVSNAITNTAGELVCFFPVYLGCYLFCLYSNRADLADRVLELGALFALTIFALNVILAIITKFVDYTTR